MSEEEAWMLWKWRKALQRSKEGRIAAKGVVECVRSEREMRLTASVCSWGRMLMMSVSSGQRSSEVRVGWKRRDGSVAGQVSAALLPQG